MKLAAFNQLARDKARDALIQCCGSTRWAERVAALRPFHDVEALHGEADAVWWSLERKDWLEAFAAHPRIGSKRDVEKAGATKEWAEGEQAGAAKAGSEVLEKLADANRAYESQFGWIYIICATGKSAEEMLARCRERLSNDSEKELRVAAEEQRKITRLRLEKMLLEESLAPGSNRSSGTGSSKEGRTSVSPASGSTKSITTHVLDTSRGRPAEGVPIVLEIRSGLGEWKEIGRGSTDADGRCRTLIAEGAALEAATYRITFDTAAYFHSLGVEGFYPEASIVFAVRDASQHYHVPLLLSPYGYATYRGS